MAEIPTRPTYAALTPRLMLQLAAPHTWPASIFPVLIATCLAISLQSAVYAPGMLPLAKINGVAVCVLLAISVLFQSAVNTINDYFDYVKGTDTKDNQDDPTDAVLVYNNVNPKSVLAFAISLIACAFVLGIYCIWLSGWVPLAIALIGVAVLFLYSGGKTPISYLPLGEVVSGFVMGELITLASYQVLTRTVDWMVLLYALPLFFGIGLIMMTNNGCDIEKDIQAQRRTLPVLLGYERMRYTYHGIMYAWVITICAIIVLFFTPGWVVLPFMLLAVYPVARMLLANPLTPASRGAAFSQVTSLNITLGAFYAAALLAGSLPMLA